MEYLLGKARALKIQNQLKENLATLPRKLKLVALVNQDDASSIGYVNSQNKLAAKLGIDYQIILVAGNQNAYLKEIDMINHDDSIDACLITRPLFKGADENKIINALDPSKDVDAMNYHSLGKIFVNDSNAIFPATSKAIMELLDEYQIEVQGKNVVVVGRSISLGKPIAMMLLNKNATVSITHSKTKDLYAYLSQADIVVACLGKPHFIEGSKLKEGAIVIDAGIHYLENGIIGDVKEDEKLLYISKVPGGVGIITTSVIMDNVYQCYKRKHQC